MNYNKIYLYIIIFSLSSIVCADVHLPSIFDDNDVLVMSDRISSPVSVRFRWSHVPEPNLFNKAGLPASHFRTDSK